METLNVANRLEGILRKFLNCNYNQFGVKANNNLLKYDWQSPINFALGALYERKPSLKEEIDSFLGNILCDYRNIENVMKEFDNYEDGIKEITRIIDLFEELLNKGNS